MSLFFVWKHIQWVSLISEWVIFGHRGDAFDENCSYSIKEVPYNFAGSSIRCQCHTGQKNDNLNPIQVRLLGRSRLSNPSDLPCSWTIWRPTTFSLSKLAIWFKFPAVCFDGLDWQFVNIHSGNGLAPKRQQTITLTKNNSVPWRIYASPGFNVSDRCTWLTIASWFQQFKVNYINT